MIKPIADTLNPSTNTLVGIYQAVQEKGHGRISRQATIYVSEMARSYHIES